MTRRGLQRGFTLFELLVATDRIRNLIMDGGSTADLRDAAKEEGMRTLRDAGLFHLYDGVTTIEEVVKETISAL